MNTMVKNVRSKNQSAITREQVTKVVDVLNDGQSFEAWLAWMDAEEPELARAVKYQVLNADKCLCSYIPRLTKKARLAIWFELWMTAVLVFRVMRPDPKVGLRPEGSQ